ncbi:MAG: ABC transporter permease, partial [Bacteroidota bacterium]
WFLEKTCTDRYLDELEGDLLELFDRDIEEFGLHKARRKFIWKVLASPRWHRLPGLNIFQNITMHQNYFKVAIRHAFKHKFATSIQCLGLLLGLAATFYIGLFIKNELDYDRMHLKSDQLYRVLRSNPISGSRGHSTSSLHGAILAEAFPASTICRFGNDPVKIGETAPLLVEDFFWSDSTFFDLFTFPFLHGDPATCLNEQNKLVITESLSQQLFGTTNALNQVLKVKVYDGNQELLMKVTGVVKDPPKHSHIQFKALGSMMNAEQLYQSLLQNWYFSWLRTYIYLPNNQIEAVKKGIPKLIEKHLGDNVSPNFGIAFQPFNKVYLYSQDIPKNTFSGNIRNLQIFGTIGLLILLITLMNYVNLATARAVTRRKEVGVRKVLGSRQSSIVAQFLMESILFAFFSGTLAILLVANLLPQLNVLLDLDLSIQLITLKEWLLIALGLLLLGILAGILPSLAFSKLAFLSNAKSAIRFNNGKWPLTRKLFVGVQYAVTLMLIMASFVIYRQYHFLKDYDKGFDSDQLLHIAVDDRNMQKQMDLLKEKMSQVPGVLGSATTGEDLPSALNNTWGVNWNGSDLENPLSIDIVGIDQDYFDLLGIHFTAGHNFTADFAVDSAKTVIINESAHQMIGRNDIVGENLIIEGRNRKVIGVVANHHNITLHSKVVPLAYFIYPAGYRVSPDNLLIKLETSNLASLLPQLEKIWSEFSPDPFTYNFVDEAFEKAYAVEHRFSTLIGAFTFMAILISIVGLFGLINFIAQLKLKEISIRRILGANQFHLMHLLGRDFLMVFVVASIFTLPLTYQFIKTWLANFAYHLPIHLGVPLLSVLLCVGISILVIIYHLERMSRVNPSEVLSGE